MNEQKKDAALDEEALKDVTGGDYNVGGVRNGDRMQGFIDQAFAQVNGNGSANDNKENQL